MVSKNERDQRKELLKNAKATNPLRMTLDKGDIKQCVTVEVPRPGEVGLIVGEEGMSLLNPWEARAIAQQLLLFADVSERAHHARERVFYTDGTGVPNLRTEDGDMVPLAQPEIELGFSPKGPTY